MREHGQILDDAIELVRCLDTHRQFQCTGAARRFRADGAQRGPDHRTHVLDAGSPAHGVRRHLDIVLSSIHLPPNADAKLLVRIRANLVGREAVFSHGIRADRDARRRRRNAIPCRSSDLTELDVNTLPRIDKVAFLVYAEQSLRKLEVHGDFRRISLRSPHIDIGRVIVNRDAQCLFVNIVIEQRRRCRDLILHVRIAVDGRVPNLDIADIEIAVAKIEHHAKILIVAADFAIGECRVGRKESSLSDDARNHAVRVGLVARAGKAG